jgi:hypothetical protein
MTLPLAMVASHWLVYYRYLSQNPELKGNKKANR